MNSSSRAIFFIFATVAVNSFCYALDLYEPIVYFNERNDHNFGFVGVEYNTVKKYYVVKTPAKNENIFIACPRHNTPYPNTFDVQKIVVGKADVIPICEEPIESQIYLSNDHLRYYNTVGFLIYKEGAELIEHIPNIPMNHEIVSLIYFKFDDSNKRIRSLWYFIIGGKFLIAEPSPQEGELKAFQKNQSVYGYDIDSSYSKPGCPFIKIPLAPQEDFLFDYWKSASRQNILTAPMWRDLQPQWQALEIFIRKVSQVIHSATVGTGIHGQLSKLSSNEDDSIHWLDESDERYYIPKYFWKAVSLQFSYNKRRYGYGILFVLRNTYELDSASEWYIKKFCSDYDFANLGWKFLQDDQFKSHILGCPLNDEILSPFGEMMNDTFEKFDLNFLQMLEFDGDGNGYVKKVNVLDEMGKLQMARELNASKGLFDD